MGSQLTGIRLQIQNHKTPTEIQSSDIKHCALIEYFLPFFYLMWLQNNNLVGKHTCKRNRTSTYFYLHQLAFETYFLKINTYGWKVIYLMKININNCKSIYISRSNTNTNNWKSIYLLILVGMQNCTRWETLQRRAVDQFQSSKSSKVARTWTSKLPSLHRRKVHLWVL